MTKRLPSRNHRSKGIKVKYVLQIILLLGVCFWLIYQVKHSHDKKKEFDENEAKTSVKPQNPDEVLKLGRKDLRRGKFDRHEEEEEDETTGEDEGNKHEREELEEEEGNKHETEEREEENNSEVREQGEENKDGAEDQDEDENKSEDVEIKERGGGDDDIDENDQELPEADADHDEEFMHEEKDKEEEVDENETENTKDEEKEGLAEEEHTHEAREEHYKADDASSAVAHDDKTTSTETETLSLENSDSNLERSNTNSEESNGKQNDSDLKVTEEEMTGHISLSARATNGGEHVNNSLSDALNGSILNTTFTANSDGHLEANGTLSVVLTDSNTSSTRADTDTMVSSEQNKTVILSAAAETQNATEDTTVTQDITNVSEGNLPHSNSTVSVKTKNGDAAKGESSNPGAVESEKIMRSVATNETENNSGNSDAKGNVDASEDGKSNDKSVTAQAGKFQNNAGNPDRKEDTGANEDDKFKANTETVETSRTQNKVGNLDSKENADAAKVEKSEGETQMGEVEETSDSSANETSVEVEHDAIDSSDSHTHKDMTEVQTDLETLPDIRNEGNNGDETAAE